MKKLITIVLFFIVFFTLPLLNVAQQTGPGNPGGEPTGSDPPLGGGAPIGSGLGILIGLGAAYGGRKFYNIRSRLEEKG